MNFPRLATEALNQWKTSLRSYIKLVRRRVLRSRKVKQNAAVQSILPTAATAQPALQQQQQEERLAIHAIEDRASQDEAVEEADHSIDRLMDGDASELMPTDAASCAPVPGSHAEAALG